MSAFSNRTQMIFSFSSVGGAPVYAWSLKHREESGQMYTEIQQQTQHNKAVYSNIYSPHPVYQPDVFCSRINTQRISGRQPALLQLRNEAGHILVSNQSYD